MTEPDLDSFQLFLSSGLFGNSKTLLKFFLLWRKRVLGVPLEKEVSLEAFVSGTSFKAKRVDKLCSELAVRLTEFFSFQEYRDNEHLKQELLLRAMERRNAALPEMNRQYDRILGDLAAKKDSTDKELQRLKLRWILAEAAIKTRETRSLWQEDFQDLSNLLDNYYNLQKLKLASARANAQSIYKHEEHNPFEDFISGLRVNLGKAELGPLALAHFLTVEMFQEESGERAFQDLIALLGEHATTFSREDSMDLYGYALNFCIRKSNQGLLNYLGYMSDLYLQLLENGLLLEGGHIVPSQFKNIVTLNCRLGKLDWVRWFIDNYQAQLPEGTEQDAVLYNEAVLAYHKKNYPVAISSLKQIILRVKDDVFYGLDARIYLWKSYFEHLDKLTLPQVDEMYKLYDSFRIFIERNTVLASTHKIQYRNFIREFKRFMEILVQIPISRTELEKLHGEVSQMEFISNKGWFLHHIQAKLDGMSA